ncbi:hypothetical protein [Thalassotalea sediminis]|uniref:hypothetical protein n=1 Tax=Thalassotalea sediminis TaxID=1759089 RepID=UPI002574041F|nr:hypothetical protein [Thalassotalea sediminis]
MNKQEQDISVQEAKLVLDNLADIDINTNKLIRPPIWLTGIIAFFYGMMTFSWAATRHENLWMLGLIISAVGFLLAVGFYLYTSQLLGVKPKILSKSKKKCIFHFSTAIFFAAVIIFSRIFSLNDLDYLTYIGAALNATVLAYLLHFHSTGHYIKKKGE